MEKLDNLVWHCLNETHRDFALDYGSLKCYHPDFVHLELLLVTHTDHLGKGYAKQLVTHTANNIFRKNKIPFLHTNADSAKNIELYEKLGFKIRREMSLWRFEP